MRESRLREIKRKMERWREKEVENGRCLLIFLVIQLNGEASLTIIKRLAPVLLNNTGTHTESGEYSVKKWIDGYTRHPKDHAEQLLAD